ncbi:unnamed protein product [Urochloa decumbens]|uniref:Uncharacterized protein n=1 Tax=Urochloa decumbens TaxID=240449 RepID=A0ABC8Z672_9POAL
MDGEGSQGIKKVHFRDSSSQVPLITYKRRRKQKLSPQQSEPQSPPPQQLEPQLEPEPEPEHKPGDVPAQQSKDTFWKSRDMGWKYGIMIDENRQHWKCMYCGLIRYGGGVSRLKRHLAGDLDVKMCPKVPADVVEEIREHLRKKRERRRKRAALNGGNNVKTKSSFDDANVEKDILPADSVLPAGMGTNVLEEINNQTSMVHQDPTYPRVPILRAKDIGWKHAVDLDGNKKRWQCKFCSLCRSGGVTTLKAHLIDDSCPNVPKEISKQVSNFIEEKRATRLLLNNYIFSVDEDEVFNTQVPGDRTIECENDQQPSRNATDVQTLDECANEMTVGSSQCDEDSSGQSVEHCDQPEEQGALDHGRMDQVIQNKNKILDKNADNSESTKKMTAGSGQCSEESSGQPFDNCDQTEEQGALDRGRMDQVIQNKNKILDKNADTSENTKMMEAGSSQCGEESSGQPVEHCDQPEELGALDHGRMNQVIQNKDKIFDKNADNSQKARMEAGAGSSQCGEESSGQPAEQCDPPEEDWAMDHGRDQVINNKNKILDKNTNNSQKHKILKPRRKCALNTRKHIIIVDEVARHWRCKYCGMDGYGKKFRIYYHLAGAFRHPKCPNVPREVFAKARYHALTKRRLKTNKAEQQIPSRPHIIGQFGEERQKHGPLCGNQSQLSVKKESSEPMWEDVPLGNGFFGDTNNSWGQNGAFGTSKCWRYVLERLMHLHLPDAQGDAGIATCIRDALLYGCAELGTVDDKVEMDSDKTMTANTAKCQNVLMNILRSENFASLCTVLCKTVHQDEDRSRYFDFDVIDSRMKNGSYGHEPELFMRDLKLLWEHLKMAGQNIIHLANCLTSLTESYEKLVVRERVSGDGEPNGAIVTISEPQILVQSDAPVPSTSQGFNQLDQPGPSDLSVVHNTCNQCGKDARGGDVLTCSRCKLSFHISCIEPPGPCISTGSWCCKNCSATCTELVEGNIVVADLHGNCVVCDRLEVCRSPQCEDTPNDNSRAKVISGVNSVEDPEPLEIDTGGSCKICGGPEEDDKRFLICGHIHCLYKYYHIRCLKSKQVAHDVQWDKPCWYCPSCLCRVCFSDKDDDLTIMCDSCDEAYHLYCIMPRRTSIPKGRWYCSSCSVKKAKEGMRQYERRTLKLHQKDNAGQQSRNCEGLDLLLSAVEQLSAD